MDLESVTCTDSLNFKVSELLKEVQLDYSPALTKLVDDIVLAIKQAIDKIPEDLEVTADLATGFVRDIGTDKVEFNFKKPKSTEIGGSYSIRCVAKPDVNVDLLVRLPKECFREKDYLNHRYHAKRCLYLCVIKKYLMFSSSIQKVEWSTLQNEARKPVLVVYPAKQLVEVPGFFVRIIPTATSLFNISKLNLKRNNVRALNEVSGSYLATQDKINNSLKALEIFRVLLDFIATSKLWEQGLYFPPEGQSHVSKEEKLQYRESFPVVICDSSTHVNLAFRMTSIGFLELQDEAALTLKCIEKCKDGGFEEIFMTKIDYPAKYDYCIRLNLKGKSAVYASGFCLDDECWRLYEQKVHNLLYQGLSDRAKLIRVIWRNVIPEWNIENGLSVLDREPLLVGISVSSIEKAFRMVDIGPNTENKEEALKFREFWGEKAELRIFKDGTIAESTVWESEQWTRHLIMKKILEYVLVRHLCLLKENIVQIVDQLDFSLIYGVKDPISFSGSLLGAFEVLSKRLRLIEDIPLKVSSVQPLDAAFRFTSVFPPESHPLANEKVDASRLHKLTPSCSQALEVMIQLEGSGNWPMDDLAIEKTKSAFLLKIAESLQNNWGITCTATEDDVDVFMAGYAFCLRILHERGLNLLKREIGSDPVKRVPSTDKILFLHSQHASMINGLQGRYPVYGPVVRLAKRWVASHLFSACLVEEAVELLVAHLFLKPLPFRVPCSRVTGFLRFLLLVAEYDWMFSPLIVDINNDLSRNDEKEINDNFVLSRKAYEENKQNISAAMFFATSYDKASEAWTGFSPSSLELKRLVAYARSSVNLLSKLILQDQSGSYRWECLFRTPLNNYDAIILLHKDRLPYPRRLLFPSELKQGRHVAHGNASQAFHPFVLPGDLKRSSEELKSKLMVNFDPLRCFAGDLQKRERDEEGEEEKHPVDVLKAVGEIGKGFVREIYLLKVPRLVS